MCNVVHAVVAAGVVTASIVTAGIVAHLNHSSVRSNM